MKAFTSIEQSEKLTEILPFKSADMCYPLPYEEGDKPLLEQGGFGSIPCWSLAALLDLLPNNKHIETTISRGGWKIEPIEYLFNTWWCEYEDTEGQTEFHVSADNPIDACYEMIIRLHEQKLL